MWRRKRRAMTPTHEATLARLEAEEELQTRRADTPRVKQLTAEWRRIREHNNIASAFEASMRGGKS